MSDRSATGPSPQDGGAILLNLLRRPPQSSAPTPPLPHEVYQQPLRDPAVTAVGPSYAFPPHSLLPPYRSHQPPPPQQQQDLHHFPFAPRGPWPPPAFLPPAPDHFNRPPDPEFPPPHTFHGKERTAPTPARPVFGNTANGAHDDGTPTHRDQGRGGRNPGPWRQEPRGEHRRSSGGSFQRSKGEWVASRGRRNGEPAADYRRTEISINRSTPRSGDDWLHGERLGRGGEGRHNLQLSHHSADATGSFLRPSGGGHLNNFPHDDYETTTNGSMDGFASNGGVYEEQDVLADQLNDSLVLNGDPHDRRVRRHTGKDLRSDSLRGYHVSNQQTRIRRRETDRRFDGSDISSFTSKFLLIYKSLIPAEEEKEKQKQLLLMLEKLVAKEWPNAQLHLYGSCANSFGVSNSDIDICLAIDDISMSKSEILLKLADILQANNLENVQALTHARVPIVKMMDPVTGISCDICINNLLAVVNTKLLRDYAQIDERLPQLAFIVKHWAKSRGVNETYRGTLSSYAYVLMCIHFLQLRRPAILPCLQKMGATYVVTVDDIRCAYFDRVERLHGFGAQNKENIAQLVWAFFHYWAYGHDYTDAVISVRNGCTISKRSKEWTRRVGNDRHLICIEDPFETSHDLGRVVDKYTIRFLRKEFELAADTLYHDEDPSVALFQPDGPGSTHN